jgi:hypothetical protein
MGAALLALGALGLSRWSPRVLLVAAIASSSTGLIALKLLLEDNPSWFVPRARIEVAMALRPHCRAGDVVMAPADIGMYVNAYTACRAFLTHAIAPDAPQREAELIAFYSPIPARDRLAILDRRCIRHVVLGSVSKVGEVRGGESGFVPSARTGDEPAALVVFTRPLACPS